MSAADKKPWVRPFLERDAPQRSFGGVYRTAEGGQANLGGVPLTTAEDAVIAAVRLAYKVADAQITRSTRLMERLRRAGERELGQEPERKALDATEQLVFRAMMNGLGWLETAAGGNEADSPIKRLLSAQYRLLGSVLGIGQSRPEPDGAPAADISRPAESAAPSRLAIFLDGSEKRPVLVRRFELSKEGVVQAAQLTFYSNERNRSEPIVGELEVDGGGRPTLKITTPRRAPKGLWRAAICDHDNRQIGLVEIEL